MRHFLFLLAIIAALVMAPVSPEAGNILFLIAGGLALFSLRKADFATFGCPIIWMPLLGLGLLGLAFSAGSGTIRGL
ncbi:MAG: hypothetical protein MO846_12095, partial [Candidatus Devosia symbiotica]|nr:hypothetical protein [Candidatus Devosia symbiotica]